MLLALCAIGVTVAVSLAMALAVGLSATIDAIERMQPKWLLALVIARLVCYLGYTTAHRHVMHVDRGPELSLPQSAGLVAVGFGVFMLGGGFTADRRALREVGAPPDQAAERVLGLGALEFAVLAPLAWLSAVVLLLNGSGVMSSLLVPWIVGVPVGSAVAALAVMSGADESRPRKPRLLGHALRALALLRRLLVRAPRRPLPWIGMLLYWCGELVALWAGLRLLGVSISVVRLVLAFATGYVFTPRTLPLAGVGLTEVTLILALHWVGVPYPAATAAVFLYRVTTLLVSLLPALLARELLGELGEAVHSG